MGIIKLMISTLIYLENSFERGSVKESLVYLPHVFDFPIIV